MNLFPMHSWHPMVVHFPLVALLLAAAFDAMAALRRGMRWRDAATLLWGVGFAGAAAALATGLIAYGRVEHSDSAHNLMTLHRNLAYAATFVLLVAAAWRWRVPYSRAAAGLGIVGTLGLGAVGYLGGEMVYRHALGIPTEVLRQVRGERLGPGAGEVAPSAAAMDSMAHQMPGDSVVPGATPPHTHAPGQDHD
jgi:uncharacterized membrane protein